MSDGSEAVHNWFGLTYCSYLAIPRSVMQSMPGDWQLRMVALLDEMRDRCDAARITWPMTEVRVRGSDGRFQPDPLCDYQRGRRDVFAERRT
jgi:hypothetical protein